MKYATGLLKVLTVDGCWLVSRWLLSPPLRIHGFLPFLKPILAMLESVRRAMTRKVCQTPISPTKRTKVDSTVGLWLKNGSKLIQGHMESCIRCGASPFHHGLSCEEEARRQTLLTSGLQRGGLRGAGREVQFFVCVCVSLSWGRETLFGNYFKGKQHRTFMLFFCILRQTQFHCGYGVSKACECLRVGEE